MKKWTVLSLTLMSASLALAAGGGHGGGHGLDEHTIKMMIYQAINVGILFVALVYFLKDGVRSFFKDKHAAFLATAEKAQAAKRQAEAEHAQIQTQLTTLENTTNESVSRAKAEAADLRNQLVQEAQALAKKIQAEAQLAAQVEVSRARSTLREQIILEATKLAKETIQQKVSGEDHKRLQGDFIQNIGAVQP